MIIVNILLFTYSLTHSHKIDIFSFLFPFVETNPLVEDAENSKVDYAFDNPAFKGTPWKLFSRTFFLRLSGGRVLFAYFCKVILSSYHFYRVQFVVRLY